MFLFVEALDWVLDVVVVVGLDFHEKDVMMSFSLGC